MSIINVQRLVDKVGKNTYSYTRVKNMLLGYRGGSTDKEIQQVRKVIKDELTSLMEKLDNL